MAARIRVLIFLVIFNLANCYKILGIFPSHDRSNYLVYSPLFRELANKYHDVTLITHFSMIDPPDSYKEVILKHDPIETRSLESVIWSDLVRVPLESLLASKCGNEGCKALMENRLIQGIIGNREKFDVIIVEQENSDCATALAYNLSGPVIAFNPQTLKPWQQSRLGIPFDSTSTPHPNLSYGKTPGILERIKTSFITHISNFVYYLASQIADHVYLYKYLGDDLPSLDKMASNVSLTLVNTHSSLFGGAVKPDNLVEVGGIHIGPLKPVPTEIERFINEAEHGVIYASFGSTLRECSMPKEKVKELIEGFAALPFRVLWKWNTSSLVGEVIPRNILVKDWMPQYEVLNHKNVKAFITHAGLLSISEAVDAGIPTISVPLFGNEHGNAAALRDAGMGVILSYHDLTRENIAVAVNTILSKQYADQAKVTSKKWHDRPLLPLENAIYWTEYVARYGGAENLQATSTMLPWYQKSNLDVTLFFITVLLVLFYGMYRVLAFCCRCCCAEEVDIYSENRTLKRKRE